MGYKSQNYCFETVEQLHSHVAAQCVPVSGGYTVVCTAHDPATVIDVTSTHLELGTIHATTFSPQLISCDFIGADYTQLLWLLAGLIVSAFCGRYVADAIRGK